MQTKDDQSDAKKFRIQSAIPEVRVEIKLQSLTPAQKGRPLTAIPGSKQTTKKRAESSKSGAQKKIEQEFRQEMNGFGNKFNQDLQDFQEYEDSKQNPDQEYTDRGHESAERKPPAVRQANEENYTNNGSQYDNEQSEEMDQQELEEDSSGESGD